jgi:hypothetical protein
MYHVQPLQVQPMLDRAAAQLKLPQLRMRHHSVLAIGQLTEETIR